MRYLFILFHVCLFTSVLNSQTPDTISPFLRCKQPGEVVLSDCFGIVHAADIIDSLSDQSGPIKLGIHRQCMGFDFPLSDQTYFGDAFGGLQPVSAWAKDSLGNISSCTTSVALAFPVNAFCDPILVFKVSTPLEKRFDDVLVKIRVQNCLGDTFPRTIDPHNLSSAYIIMPGWFESYGALYPGNETYVEMIKDINPLNGVTTYDLSLISKHILGLEMLDSPYKIIAADANQDGKVTTFDVVVLRKLILGIIDELPNGKSWRFLPQGYVFPNAVNPFEPPFPTLYHFPASEPNPPGEFPFIGVKIGDVNDSAFPGG